MESKKEKVTNKPVFKTEIELKKKMITKGKRERRDKLENWD